MLKKTIFFFQCLIEQGCQLTEVSKQPKVGQNASSIAYCNKANQDGKDEERTTNIPSTAIS